MGQNLFSLGIQSFRADLFANEMKLIIVDLRFEDFRLFHLCASSNANVLVVFCSFPLKCIPNCFVLVEN